MPSSFSKSRIRYHVRPTKNGDGKQKSKSCSRQSMKFKKLCSNVSTITTWVKIFEVLAWNHRGNFKESTLVSKMQLHLNLIAAACENMGIGINGTLPWKLKSEMAFFTRMTTTTKDKNKKNVVLMGRRTWECIPKKYRPLRNRVNMVLSSRSLNYGDEAIACKSIQQALEMISQVPLKDKVESIWVIGGSSVYKAAMESPNFYRLYLTRVKKTYECDTFFPKIPKNFVLTREPEVPQGLQDEDGVQFEYEVYKNE